MVSWLTEVTNEKLNQRLRLKSGDLFDAEDDHEHQPEDRSHEYVQIEKPQYLTDWRFGRAQRWQWDYLLDRAYMVKWTSESLGKHTFPMPDKKLEDPRYDNVVLSPTVTVRCVTIKRDNVRRPVSGFLPGKSNQVYSWGLKNPLNLDQPKAKTGKGTAPKSKGPNPGGRIPPQFSSYDFLPIVYVQYAQDTSGLDAKIKGLESQRDQKLSELGQETQSDLGDLRRRLGWISLATFFSILVGSLLLISLGLAPLSRLSDAVSRVSSRDFKLRVDPDKLPKELQPIAKRLAETLVELGKAFAREKQAAADISHELRTPLAALLTTAEVGLKKPRSPEEYRELLEDCKLSGEQMMQLVERLLSLARLDASADRLRSAPVDVANLAHQCADLVRPLADAQGLSLTVHTEVELPVHADAVKLREVLTNLLHNAIQYNKPNGSIDLTVERQNGHLLMQVRDTGIGISAEAREHIFERFYRADPSRHSNTPHAGLGLAIVKSYVDLMGGNIEVDSGAQGTTFRIEVPAVDAREPSTNIAALANTQTFA